MRTNTNDYYICIPMSYNKPMERGFENQDSSLQGLRICSFSTLLLPKSFTISHWLRKHGSYFPSRARLEVDKLVAEITTCSSSRQKYRYRRACMRLRRRLRCLVTEVHCQLAKLLAANYDVIMIPLFEVSKMVKRAKRKIHSTTARSMMTWGHYRFRQRLIHKARQ